MDLDDLLEEFKDDHKNQNALANGVGAVKGAKKSAQQEDEWGAFSGGQGAVAPQKKAAAVSKQSNGWGDEEDEFNDYQPSVMPKANTGAVQMNKQKNKDADDLDGLIDDIAG